MKSCFEHYHHKKGIHFADMQTLLADNVVKHWVTFREIKDQDISDIFPAIKTGQSQLLCLSSSDSINILNDNS